MRYPIIKHTLINICPKAILDVKNNLKKRIILSRLGFKLKYYNGEMVIYRKGDTIYKNNKVNDPYKDHYILALIHVWPKLINNGFDVYLGNNSMVISKSGKRIYIEEIDRQVLISDYMKAIINYWDTIIVDGKGKIISIAGVILDRNKALVNYNGHHLEYEIKENWWQNNLEDIMFFPDILPNYFYMVKPKNGDVVFDLGGHHGLFSLAASVETGYNSQIYCFEPDDENRKIIKNNLLLNNIKNVEIVPLIICGSKGKKRFIKNCSLSSRLLNSNDIFSEKNIVEIESTTLWDFCEKRFVLKPDFVKADIEGAELEMITGNFEWIAKNNIVFSIASYHLVDKKPTWYLLEKIFKKLGYEVFTIPWGHITTIAKKDL